MNRERVKVKKRSSEKKGEIERGRDRQGRI
jgi:hypothetical protein